MTIKSGPSSINNQQLASSPEASAWVSASAGTGKTKVLTDRILRLMLEGVAPQRILCLTFTRAAAAEMANRVKKQLVNWQTVDDIELIQSVANNTTIPVIACGGIGQYKEFAAGITEGGASAVAAGNIAVVKQHLADKTYHESFFEFHRLLNVAVLEGHKEIAELLISKGADVNAKDKMGLGRTPLIEAIHGNQIDLIELLIAKEADVNLQDGHETPLDLAKGNKEIYDLLRKHGGKTGEELKAEGK